MFNLSQKINQLVFTPFCRSCRRHRAAHTHPLLVPALETRRPPGPSSLVFRSGGFSAACGQKHSVRLHLQEMGALMYSEFEIANSSWFVTFLATKNVCHAVYKVVCIYSFLLFPCGRVLNWREGRNELSGVGLRYRTIRNRKILA